MTKKWWREAVSMRDGSKKIDEIGLKICRIVVSVL
jgi:hypothetical protein